MLNHSSIKNSDCLNLVVPNLLPVQAEHFFSSSVSQRELLVKQVRPLKLLGLGGLLNSFTDDDEEVLSQNEGNSLSLVPKLLLLVIQEMTKVNVEELEEEEEEESGESLNKAA